MISQLNTALSTGTSEPTLYLKKYAESLTQKAILRPNFGLSKLPSEPGVLVIRGPRQFGKSTWLEGEVNKTFLEYGIGSALYFNCDEIKDAEDLKHQLTISVNSLNCKLPIAPRIFIDEICAIKSWEQVIKILVDTKVIDRCLLVTTGSNAHDLRRGVERLPGRKGKLDRTNFIFLPISFNETKQVFRRIDPSMDDKTILLYYLISGGSPLALNELLEKRALPEYIVQMTQDWIYGELSRSGRERSNVFAILQKIYQSGGNVIGFAKLARDVGLANNTVAQGYINQFVDLLSVGVSFQWDPKNHISIRRKECKFHFINLLVATAFSSHKIRGIADFEKLTPEEQGMWYEWLVAQELFRRRSLKGEDFSEQLNFWRSREHEIDFIDDPCSWIEVKRGNISPHEFMFLKQDFPDIKLTAICRNKLPDHLGIRCLTMEEFLGEVD